MKWIDLKTREPRLGQTVVLKTFPITDSFSRKNDLVLCIYGDSPEHRYPFATHWCPVPTVDDAEEQARKAYQRRLWPPDVITQADAMEAEMAKRSPRIQWHAEPIRLIRDTVLDQPTIGQMYAPVLKSSNYVTGWRIEGTFDTGVDEFHFAREITNLAFRDGTIDWYGYIAHEMSRALAEELLKSI